MPRNKKRTPKENGFQAAVLATPEVEGCYQAGLKALKKDHRLKIAPANPSKCEGSLDIDACTLARYPDENRWDYAVAYDSKVYFVEVHPAETGEVSTILRKLQWLKGASFPYYRLLETQLINQTRQSSIDFIALNTRINVCDDTFMLLAVDAV